MFKSYSIKYKEFKNNKHYYDTTIIDDDFEETTVVDRTLPDYTMTIMAITVIKIYSKRNLNVAKNLYLFMKSEEGKHDWKIQNQIVFYKKYVPEFEKYLSEINCYLAID